MMTDLLARGESAAREAKRRRLDQIARMFQEQGFAVEAAVDRVVIRGRNLVKRWLSDPLIRFAGSGR